MALDFQQVREQIIQMGENAPLQVKKLNEARQRAQDLLESHAHDLDELRQKVRRIVQNYDPNLRCALPVAEALDGQTPLPAPPEQATILAADGSQIAPDRHEAVNYCLINVGAIQQRLGTVYAPQTSVNSQLYTGEGLFSGASTMTEARLALLRDLNERQRLAELAEGAQGPVITFTDGPMELWSAGDTARDPTFQDSLAAYQEALERLHFMNVTTAGYVDKPAASLVVRLLEVADLAENDLSKIKDHRPLSGVIDTDLYRQLLEPGERSAVLGIQSRSAGSYRGDLSLYFFYLNVGRAGHPWLARVEVPAWVAGDEAKLQGLHAVLIQQCQVLGSRPYPYLLHRAHEAALVSWEEKEQVTQMIIRELRQRGVEVGEMSYKQSTKALGGRRSYRR